MKSILDDSLTSSQIEAITHYEGPLIIIAGPGSGKTEVMIRRTAYLICEKAISPEAILVVTFTNKAADQLKDRLFEYIGRNLENMQVSTIHSFCQRMLDEYCEYHQYGRNYQVLDEKGQYLFVYSHLKDLGLDVYARGNLGEFLGNVTSVFNRCTEEIVDYKKFNRYVERLYNEDKKYEVYFAITNSYPIYLNLLSKGKFLDFGNLQKVFYEMLMLNKVALSEIQNRFKHIIVDEYQGTNALQDLILRTVAKPEDNLCVVGDDDQSIYRFRGATVGNFLEFEQGYRENPRFKKVHIRDNFRSTKQIVSCSQKLIQRNPEKARYPKDLVSFRGNGNEIFLIYEETWAEEAEKAARVIKGMKENGIIDGYGEVAILFSSVKYYASEYMEALERNNIPFTVIGDGKFFEREDILVLRELMKYCAWKYHWQDYFFDNSVLSLSPETVKAIGKLKDDPLESNCLEKMKKLGINDEKDQEKLLSLFGIKTKVLQNKHTNILSVFYDLLDASKYFSFACENKDEEILLNLAQLSSIIDDFDQHVKTKSIFRFNQYLWGLPPKSVDEIKLELPDALKIMTVHQAKGLEFPLVIIGSAVEGRFPKRRRSEKFPLPPELRLSKDEEVEDLHILDERKLFYVAISRAKDILIFATSNKINKRGSGPSRFIKEIGETVKLTQLDGRESLKKLIPIMKRSNKTSDKPRERITYSAINTFLLCPLRYKFIYECRFRLPKWPLYVYGQSLHRTLENIHLIAMENPGKKFSQAEVEQIYFNNWIPLRTKRKDLEERFKNLGKEYIWRYTRKYNKDFYKISKVEPMCSYPLEDFLVVGKIDLIKRTNGSDGVEIIDFKTRAWEGLTKKNTELQLQIYAIATQNTLDVNVQKISAYLLADDKRVDFDWNPAIEGETINILQEVGAKIAAKEFPPNPGIHCQDCDFINLCPYSKELKENETTKD
jgi:DNA helicase-2/ATP-dependent DNA helicase PcrA